MDDGIEIFRFDIKTPRAVGAILAIAAALAAWAVGSFAWDLYRPVDGVVRDKRMGFDESYALTVEEDDGSRFEKSVSLGVYVHTKRGDRVTKEAGFFEPIRTTGVEQYEAARRRLEEVRRAHGIE